MNYLFQLRGLLDDSGVPHVDFSGQTLAPLNEATLPSGLGTDPSTFASPRYRTGWYAPASSGAMGSVATKHCDGTPLLTGDLSRCRWSAWTARRWPPPKADSTGIWLEGGRPQDINFDGAAGVPAIPDFPAPGADLNGFNDWANLRLNQVGARRNVGAWFWVLDRTTSDYFAFMGPLSLDVGRGDLGRGDLGRGDLGRGDLGRGDLGRGDLGRGDLGRGDLGRGDLGRGDLGRGDLGRGDLGRGDLGRGDLGEGADFEISGDLVAAGGYTPPTELKAFVRGTNGSSSIPALWVPAGEPQTCGPLGAPALVASDCHRIRPDWKRTNLASEIRVSSPSLRRLLDRRHGRARSVSSPRWSVRGRSRLSIRRSSPTARSPMPCEPSSPTDSVHPS